MSCRKLSILQDSKLNRIATSTGMVVHNVHSAQSRLMAGVRLPPVKGRLDYMIYILGMKPLVKKACVCEAGLAPKAKLNQARCSPSVMKQNNPTSTIELAFQTDNMKHISDSRLKAHCKRTFHIF